MGSDSCILCQICYKTPDHSGKLFFSACGHIGCISCVSKGEFRTKCSICNKEKQRVIEINSKMNSEVTSMFLPFAPQLSKFSTDFERAYKFQLQGLNLRTKKTQHMAAQFEKLKEYCQSEMKKKDQYKQKFMQLVEHQKNLDNVASALRLQIQKQQVALNAANLAKREMATKKDETLNLANMTHDPFRTPAFPRNNRSFVTSTPYARDTNDSVGDASLSFSAATGYSTHNNDNEVSLLSKQAAVFTLGDNVTPASTKANTVRRQVSGGSGKKRASDNNSEHSSSVVSAFSSTQFTATSKPSSRTPSKKTRLELQSKTMPLPTKQ